VVIVARISRKPKPPRSNCTQTALPVTLAAPSPGHCHEVSLAEATKGHELQLKYYTLQRLVYLKEVGVEAFLRPRSIRVAENEHHTLKKSLGNDDARALLGIFIQLPR